MTKFGPIKRQHGRVAGLDELLARIIRQCPHVSRIVPGRMGRKRGNTPAKLRIQYATARGAAGVTGLKCIYTQSGSWQEVFLVCDDAEKARRWLVEKGLAEESGR
jgi:hypothetical protein